MATKADLRRMMLTHLKVINSREVPSNDQTSLADLWIDAARGMLMEKGLCWWDGDDIPAAVLIPVVNYTAGLCCAAFGKNGKGYEAQVTPARLTIASMASGEERPDIVGEYS